MTDLGSNVKRGGRKKLKKRRKRRLSASTCPPPEGGAASKAKKDRSGCRILLPKLLNVTAGLVKEINGMAFQYPGKAAAGFLEENPRIEFRMTAE